MQSKINALSDHLAEQLRLPVAYDGIGANGAHTFRIGADASRTLFLAADLVSEWDVATITGLMVARRVVTRLRSAPGAAMYMDSWELRYASPEFDVAH